MGPTNESRPEGLTKRQLLGGMGAMAAGTVLPTWRRAEAASKSAYDVIVIGGGTCGLPLAITASERGARVLVIEKAPIIGGTLDRSSAQTSAAGTVLQQAKGIKDTPDEHFDDIMRITRNTADPALTRLWVDHAAEAVNWLIANGLKYADTMPVVGNHEPYYIPRAQTPPGSGKAVLAVLTPIFERAVTGGKVSLKLESRAIDLIQDNKGAVIGVVVQDEAGKLHEYMGSNIVLTAGGCMANPIMFEQLHKVPLYQAAGYPYCQGDGLLLGQSAGGYVRGGEGYCPVMGRVMTDDSVPSVPLGGAIFGGTIHSDAAHRTPWELWVNARGERFVREDEPSVGHRERMFNMQPSHRMWIIHDQEAMDKASPPMRDWSRDQYMAEFGSNSMFFKADSLRQLAVKAGVNPRGLVESVTNYNSALAEKAPDKLGRLLRPAPVLKPPFYAIRAQGTTVMTYAGLAVDHSLRVIRPDGTPITNLYAAGEVIGATATSGAGYCNGNMVTPAITFGRQLGQRILKLSRET